MTRIQPGRTIEQSHMRSRALVSQWVYEKGMPENVISRIEKDGKTYFVINDYRKLRTLYGRFLAEIQRITSEGDYEAAKNLVEAYGVKIDPELHAEVSARYAKLNLAPTPASSIPSIRPSRTEAARSSTLRSRCPRITSPRCWSTERSTASCD